MEAEALTPCSPTSVGAVSGWGGGQQFGVCKLLHIPAPVTYTYCGHSSPQVEGALELLHTLDIDHFSTRDGSGKGHMEKKKKEEKKQLISWGHNSISWALLG